MASISTNARWNWVIAGRIFARSRPICPAFFQTKKLTNWSTYYLWYFIRDVQKIVHFRSMLSWLVFFDFGVIIMKIQKPGYSDGKPQIFVLVQAGERRAWRGLIFTHTCQQDSDIIKRAWNLKDFTKRNLSEVKSLWQVCSGKYCTQDKHTLAYFAREQ